MPATSLPAHMMTNSHLSADPELAFVIDASGGGDRQPSGAHSLNWQRVLSLAVKHRVYPRVARYAHLMPEPIAADIRALAQQNAHAALRNVARTREVAELLRAAGVESVVLKGPLLARELYGDLSLRVSGDIDLLVQESDLLRASQALQAAGYDHHTHISAASLAKHRKAHHDISFAHPEDQSLVELHADVAQPHYGIRLDLLAWWRDRREVPIGDAALAILSPEHGYLMTAVHAAKHRWERLDLISDVAAYQLKALDRLKINREVAGTWMISGIQTGEELAGYFYGTSGISGMATATAAKKVVAGESFGRRDGFAFDLELRENPKDKLRYLLARLLSAKAKL